MPRTIAIGMQDFGELIRNNCFYIDKTDLIREWWENKDIVTLINRPRRFGKTLNMSMIEYFFSVKYADEKEIFKGLNIWKNEKYRQLQGTYPVIFLSFANVKTSDYSKMKYSIGSVIFEEYEKHRYLLDGNILSENEKIYFNSITANMDDAQMAVSINFLSNFLSRYYKKKVIILLDEYDTPMQEAYVYGYWNEAAEFFRSFFNATFKTNPYMERSLITGITRISKESLFSDFNNPKVITTTTEQYATCFGFTEDEVFAAMDEYEFDCKDKMKNWYDGFTFGKVTDIYNPWSVINSIKDRKFLPYWVNTSSNSLVNKLVREAGAEVKKKLESLIKNESIECVIDEEIVYNQLDTNADAIWSLLLASGYLKVIRVFKNMEEPSGDIYDEYAEEYDMADDVYELRLTNLEVRKMMRTMIAGWFNEIKPEYNGFIDALLSDNVRKMNTFINKVSLNTFSYFDTGNRPSKEAQPERFYHGFVLGLIVDLSDIYEVKSNRESGFGRYDVMLKPHDINGKAFIFEFKVKDADDDETTLEDTVKNALAQIEEKQYETELTDTGIKPENIRKYGFAFEGKKVLIGRN
jgi:hypothetical protein